MERGRRALLIAAVAALGAAATAVAGGSALPVSLTLQGSASPDLGQAVTLTAKSKLPRGDHLLIQGVRLDKTKIKVKECPRSPCVGRWKDTEGDLITFRAFAVKRAGKKVSTLGRSKTIRVTWAEPAIAASTSSTSAPPALTPPPPPPAAVPGHYDGRTSQNEIFAFDVSADGRGITGLRTGQINESCEPPDYYLSGGNLSDWSGPVALDGTFTMSFSGNEHGR